MKPLFRDPCEGDEREDGYSEPFGFLLGPMGVFSRDEMADQYFLAANVLVEQVQQRNVADYDIAYPVLFLFRHAMELMLKSLLGQSAPHHHRLNSIADDFAAFVHREHRQEVPRWIVERLHELARIDPTSEAFRYGEDKYQGTADRSGIPAETYVRVMELHDEMNRLYGALRRALLVMQGKNPDAILHI
jgi:hypothetical protein